jgi:hypothetical protein
LQHSALAFAGLGLYRFCFPLAFSLQPLAIFFAALTPAEIKIVEGN